MALSWRTLYAMPRLTNYADAAKREAETKPIRGRTPEVKPLGRRRQAYYSIKREESGDICVYCGPLVLLRYRPDDTLHIYDPGYWNKATYNDVILEVTSICTETKDGKMWAHVDGGRYLIRPSPRRKYLGEGKYAEPTDPVPENIFKRVEKFAQGHNQTHGYLTWTYVNPPTNIVHAIRRKEMRVVRERYANFIAYATALDSIREGHPQPQEYEELFGLKFGMWNDRVHYTWYHEDMPPPVKDFTHTHAAELAALMLSEDATDNYKAYLWLNVKRGWLASNTTIADLIDRVLIMHYHNEVLTMREATAGKVARDRYAWAVPA